MTEIPEHLLKRAKAARDKAADDAAAPAADAGDSRIPDHLLERSKAARGDGGAVAVADKASAVVTAAPSAGLPVGAGPGVRRSALVRCGRPAPRRQYPAGGQPDTAAPSPAPPRSNQKKYSCGHCLRLPRACLPPI